MTHFGIPTFLGVMGTLMGMIEACTSHCAGRLALNPSCRVCLSRAVFEDKARNFGAPFFLGFLMVVAIRFRVGFDVPAAVEAVPTAQAVAIPEAKVEVVKVSGMFRRVR